MNAQKIGYHLQNIDYKLIRTIDRIRSIYDILGIFNIAGINITNDYWIGVYQQEVDEINNKNCAFFVRDLNQEMTYNVFKDWCKKEGKSTYRYINLKTSDDQIEYTKEKGLINKNIYEKKIILKNKDSILLTTNKDVMAEKLGMYILDVDSKLGGRDYDKNL
ncbi:hypothetical protein [Metaclostridioides mangenotii]|uniref:hypothetical protein n=1 Tax=Metaclostridioides mangenotii TaxID=1540 RepID=UPI00048977C5|nr:hypothetical protein [Clostridioides mangenotii]